MKKRILAGLLALVTALSLTACGEEDAAPTAPQGTAVETMTVGTGDMKNASTLSGTVIADSAVAVVPMAQGKVSGLTVQAGDMVEKGQLLFTIDTSTVTAGYGALASSYEATKKMTNEAIANAELGLETAKTNLANTEALFAIGAASEFELTQARNAVIQAESGIAQAKASQQASLSQIQSSLSSIGAQAANGKVKAPCSGLVTSVMVTEGGMAGGGAAMLIAEGGRTRVSVSVSETLYGALKVGDTAEVLVPAVSQEPYTGMIAKMDVAANPQTALYEVRLYTPDTYDYPIGSFAEVTFHTDKREGVVKVPTEAILTDGGEQFVYTVEGGTAHKNVVTTGLVSTTETEILTGLTGGETLVVKGQSYLSEGAPVRVVGEGTK